LEYAIVALLWNAQGAPVRWQNILECAPDRRWTRDAARKRIESASAKLREDSWRIQSVKGVGYRLVR
jgi:DNA-binding response OmpR family regulator